MSKLDQLIAKALSTDSEEEAITCLKFARKHASSDNTVKSFSKQEKTAQSIESQQLREQLRILNHMYTDAATRAQYFMNELTKTQIERNVVTRKLAEITLHKGMWKLFSVMLSVTLIGTILVLL